MGYDDASVVLLTCGDRTAARRVRRLQHGGRTAHHAATGQPRSRPARPGRADIDPLLAGPLRRIVVAGTDADLAAVLVRLLRRDRLDVELAYVPADRRSAAAASGACRTAPRPSSWPARASPARPPLVRDDAGGVLVGRGEIRGTAGSVHGEAYCDGVLALRGSARRLVVTPWPDAAPSPGGVRRRACAPGSRSRASRWGALPDGRNDPVPATAAAGRGAAVGRAVQVGCLPATVVHDGVVHPRPVTRWAWYRHVADWLLVRR